MHKDVEVYTEDRTMKSKAWNGHAPALKKLFERAKEVQHALERTKHTFKATFKKLIRYVVNS